MTIELIQQALDNYIRHYIKNNADKKLDVMISHLESIGYTSDEIIEEMKRYVYES